MLEITSTQGLLDHDTSQAVLIIWTAPSAPLIFYPQQFIRSSVCTHTLIHSPLHQKKKKKAFSSVPVCMVRCFCMACSDDSETERVKDRGKAGRPCMCVCVLNGGAEGSAQERLWGGWGTLGGPLGYFIVSLSSVSLNPCQHSRPVNPPPPPPPQPPPPPYLPSPRLTHAADENNGWQTKHSFSVAPPPQMIACGVVVYWSPTGFW